MQRPAAETVQALFGAFAARDAEAVIARCDPAFEFWPQGTAERAQQTKPYRGHDGIRRYFADVARAWDWLAVEPGELRIAGRGVVAFGVARGRSAGEEAEVEIPVIWVFKLGEDGRALSARVVNTVAEADAALVRQGSA